MLTGSRLVRGVEETIATKRINSEAAVLSVISDVARGFESLPDPYMAARADDVREVGARLIRNLTETPFQGFSHLQPGTIIIAEELSPADAALIDPDTVAARFHHRTFRKALGFAGRRFSRPGGRRPDRRSPGRVLPR